MYGTRLRELRTEKGLSQQKLAIELNTTQKNISKYELEFLDLNTSLIIKICKYFDVSADYLLGLEDENGNKINQEVQAIHNDNRNYNISTKNHHGNINIK